MRDRFPELGTKDSPEYKKPGKQPSDTKFRAKIISLRPPYSLFSFLSAKQSIKLICIEASERFVSDQYVHT